MYPLKKQKFGPNPNINKTVVDNFELDNVNEFCYLGHTIYNNKIGNHIDLRISRATSKFFEMSKVLKDKQISLSTRVKFLESCVRSRLTYALQSCYPKESQLKSLESCWYGFLRQMVKGGFRRKGEVGDQNFSFVYTNKDLENIAKTPPLRDFINTQYLRYIAHVCRMPNTNLTKLSLFFNPPSYLLSQSLIENLQTFRGYTYHTS